MSQSNPLHEPSRDSVYYTLDDGVIFLIENKLYRIPRSLLLQSEFFRDMFAPPITSEGGNIEGNSDATPIRPEGVTTMEIKNLLDLLNARALEGVPEFTLEQLSAILNISTRWGFEKARSYTISQIDKLGAPALDRIEMAFKCIVPKWLSPAYEELCTRSEQLTFDEATRLGIQRYFVVSKIRELLQPGRPKPPTPVVCNGQLSVYCNYCRGNRTTNCNCPSCGRLTANSAPIIDAKAEINKHKGELGLAEG